MRHKINKNESKITFFLQNYLAYCKLYINFAAVFNKLKLNIMKRFSFELKKDEDAIKLILPLKKNAKTRRISIIISENIEFIGYTTLQRLKN